MNQTRKVDADDLRRVAELANLELSASEEEHLLRDLNAILGQVAQMSELDTSSIPAMAQVSEIAPGSSEASTPFREDVTVPSLDREIVMAGAPDSDGVYFRVPKVIER